MITSWKVGGISDSWWVTTFRKIGSISRTIQHKDYAMAILEVASPDMSLGDILTREAFWKTKLGVRAHGLNGN
jgi:hypothetical protein